MSKESQFWPPLYRGKIFEIHVTWYLHNFAFWVLIGCLIFHYCILHCDWSLTWNSMMNWNWCLCMHLTIGCSLVPAQFPAPRLLTLPRLHQFYSYNCFSCWLVHMFYTCRLVWSESVRSGLLSVQISWSRAAAFRLAHLSNWYDTLTTINHGKLEIS